MSISQIIHILWILLDSKILEATTATTNRGANTIALTTTRTCEKEKREKEQKR